MGLYAASRAYRIGEGEPLHKAAFDRFQDNLHISAVSACSPPGLDGLIHAMTFALEARDPYTANHQRRVSLLATCIARQLGLPQSEIGIIRTAGLLHDIGKLSIPASILTKRGALAPAEWELVRSHPKVGFDMLKDTPFPPAIALIALQHHERQDGSGYPNGTSGSRIAAGAAIIAVADVVEAMASDRPYRAAPGVAAALREITTNSGVHYDAESAAACVRLLECVSLDIDSLLADERARELNGT